MACKVAAKEIIKIEATLLATAFGKTKV